MHITKEVMDRYLSGKASAEEAEAIRHALDHNLIDLNDWLPQTEWYHTQENTPFERRDNIRQLLITKIKRANRRRLVYAISKYAAIFILAGAIGWGLFDYWKKPAQPAPITAQHKEPVPLPQSPLKITAPPKKAVQKPEPKGNLYYINSGNLPMQVAVPDGSKIELYPNSEVKFADGFAALAKRDIYLKGKATFTVAKDRSKPFRVHTAGLMTTALGTVFSVDELQYSVTKVKLYEGRIQVQGVGDKPGTTSLNMQFVPNEEVTINHRALQIIAESRTNSSAFNRKGFYQEKQNRLIFKNMALKDILNIISHNYKVQLQFDTEAIENKYYSGTYESAPSVYLKILTDLQQLHNIVITVQNEN